MVIGVGINLFRAGVLGGDAGVALGVGSALAQILALSPSLLIWPAEATMTQATNGTGAAPGVGDPVGRIEDLSGNANNLIAGTWATPADSSRALYGRVPLTGRRNLLTRTEEFDNAAWAKNNATVTANSIAAPDGTMTADKLVETAVTNLHGLRPESPTAGLIYTFQVSLKEAERRYAVVSFGGSNTSLNGGGIFVDLRTGAVLSSAGNKLVSHSVVSQGDGWWQYRVSVDMTGIVENPFAFVFLIDNSTHTIGTAYGSKSYAGDGTSGIYIWGAQLELGSTATAYQRVTTAQDVTEAGVADTFYIQPDAVNDSMEFLSALSARTIIAAVRVPTNYTTNDRFLTSNDEAINVSVNAGDWTNTGSGSTRINKASGATFTAGGAFQLLTIEYASSQAFTRLWFSATGSQFGSMDVAALAVFATPPSEADRNTAENILGGIIGL